MSLETLARWTPYRAAWFQGQMIVDWFHPGDGRMEEPFFYETIVKAFTQPFNQLFQRRSLADDLASLPQGLKPTGFIFHLSRCGSTLCTQALASDRANVVVSESAALRSVLQAQDYGPATREQVVAWLRGLVNAYGQQRHPLEERVFVKFLSADVLQIELIEEAFPDVPWLFLYRHPLEILASLQSYAGVDVLRGGIPPERLGLASEDVADMTRETYICHTLEAFSRAALGARKPGRSLFVDYVDLPNALIESIPAHFGYELDDRARLGVEATLGRNSKNPSSSFSKDGAIKRAAAAPWAELVELILGQTYAELRAASG
jgi:hypothetical protein